MEHVRVLVLLPNAVNHTLDVRLVAIKQMSEVGDLQCLWTAVRMPLDTEEGLIDGLSPFQGSIGVLGVDFVKE
jgi:hypothetical protein